MGLVVERYSIAGLGEVICLVVDRALSLLRRPPYMSLNQGWDLSERRRMDGRLPWGWNDMMYEFSEVMSTMLDINSG